MEKNLIVKIIGLLYLIGGIGILIIAIVALASPPLVIDTLNLVLPLGGFHAGDTFITTTQLYFGAYFIVPMVLITGILSSISGYLFLTSDKKIGWYLTIAASILYCLLLIGLIVDVIILRDDIRELFTS